MAFDQSYAVAENSPTSERFTCPTSLDVVHQLRRCSDAVLVGRGTVVRDDCTLTVRRVELFQGMEQPVRVVIDPTLRILEGKENGGDAGGSFALLHDEHRTIVYYSEGRSLPPNNPLGKLKEVALEAISPTTEGVLSPTQILSDLHSKGIHHVMVEGGPATAIQFLKEGVVDRAMMFRAPMRFVDPVTSGMSNDTLEQAGLVLLKSMPCGEDVVEYWTRNGEDWPGNMCIEDGWPC